jgi:phytanoyl-CoA hydroxylase
VLIPETEQLDLTPVLEHFVEHGWARLGRVLSDEGIEQLRARADDLMAGRVTYPGLFFQAEAESGRYQDLELGKGFVGPGDYRKIEKVERDPLFLQWIENALFERIARARIEGDVVLYRAVLFSKSARGGTYLPWHQDGGTFWGLDRDPHLQIWTALDDAPVDGGCVEVLPGTHRGGLATPNGGVVPANHLAAREVERETLAVPVRAGEALLIHNLLWHRSRTSQSGHPRRALTVCYMSAETRCLRKKRAPRLFFPVFPGTQR